MTAKERPTVGEAGRREKVRSDLWVRVALHDSGGVELQVHSRVEPYYGDAIRAQLRSMCEALGIENASVEVEDQGALPFTIAARLECAVRRAGMRNEIALPEPLDHAPPATQRDRLRRSRLYLPGNDPKFMINALLHGADGVILDLEDSVAAQEKDAARLLVRNALRSVDFGDAERMVRINPGELGSKDLDAVVPQAPNLILIPKCETVEQVEKVDDHVRALQRDAKQEHPIWLMPIVETALGVERALSIATASPRVAALTIGLEDYTADLGVERTTQGRESLHARMTLVNAAKAAGVQAIDSVYSDVGDPEGLRRSTLEAKALGFEGKGCIHPRQIGVIHAAFAPSDTEVAKARRIVAAFEAATAQGLGVVSLGTKMIDPPVVKRAQHTVDLAVLLGLLAPDWREGDTN
jgi:citrate lyase subunit beta/citryl-CoA lyase